MRTENRRRDHMEHFRVSETERLHILEQIEASGLSKQDYILSAVKGARISSADEVAALKEISKTFSGLERQLRGLATNVNQMAHVANGQGIVPTEKELEQLYVLITKFREESEDVWQSIRSSISQPKATEQ